VSSVDRVEAFLGGFDDLGGRVVDGGDASQFARLVVLVRLHQLVAGVHDERSHPRHGLSDRTAAEKFVGENGGRIVPFDQVPRDYVLASDGAREGISADDDGNPRHRPTD